MDEKERELYLIREKSIKDKAKKLVQASINIITMFFMLYILGFIF